MALEDAINDLTAAVMRLSGDITRLLEIIEQPTMTLEAPLEPDPVPALAEPTVDNITDDELRKRLATAVGTDLSKGVPIKAFLRSAGVDKATALDQAARRQLLKEMGA